jgi:uncharacterized protein YfaT (DUF1175 family)
MKRTIIITALVVTLAGGTLYGASHVLAQDASGQYTSPLVQKIANKFGLNKNDVQAVFDQDKQDRMAQMEAKFEEQLSQYVNDGKITDAQKQLIIQKHKALKATMQSEFENMKNKTPDERRAAMEAKKQELDTWAKQNGIDPQYLFPNFGRRGHGMMGGPPPMMP